MKENIETTFRLLLEDSGFIDLYLSSFSEAKQYLKTKISDISEIDRIMERINSILGNIYAEERSLTNGEKLLMWDIVRNYTIEKRKERKHLLWLSTSLVAAAAILCIVYITGSHKIDSNIDVKALAKIDLKKQQNIELLEGNKTIEINSKVAEIQYDNAGNINIKGEENSIETENITELNQLLIPFGRSSMLTLSDGTKIWVNSGSRLVYPNVFKKDLREIYVDGEIYLEVAKNENIPFIVRTASMDVKVLGTHFNVRAYNNSDKTIVSLEEGAVRIYNRDKDEEADLAPNQLYSYNTSTSESVISPANVSAYSAWRNGFLIFNSEKIETVLNQLERYYDIDFKFDSVNMKNIILSGKLDLNDNCEKVLEAVAVTAPIRFERSGDSRYIVTYKE